MVVIRDRLTQGNSQGERNEYLLYATSHGWLLRSGPQSIRDPAGGDFAPGTARFATPGASGGNPTRTCPREMVLAAAAEVDYRSGRPTPREAVPCPERGTALARSTL